MVVLHQEDDCAALNAGHPQYGPVRHYPSGDPLSHIFSVFESLLHLQKVDCKWALLLEQVPLSEGL